MIKLTHFQQIRLTHAYKDTNMKIYSCFTENYKLVQVIIKYFFFGLAVNFKLHDIILHYQDSVKQFNRDRKSPPCFH